MSVVLTVVSLGARVALALRPLRHTGLGVSGIWWSVPVGWFLADAVGLVCYRSQGKRLYALPGQAEKAA